MSDKELWVQTDAFGRCRLAGNAHTFRGRISAWSETLNEWVTIDRRDIREAPAEAWAWIDGFLAGNEPEFHAFLGLDPNGVEDFDEPTDERWARYQAMLDEFRRTGALRFPLNPRPRIGPPAGLSVEPWVLVAGQVLRWDGHDWSPQQPQPELHFALMAGTVCDERGHCRLDEGDERFVACVDCGSLSEVVPLA